jgi:hypothetical protein
LITDVSGQTIFPISKDHSFQGCLTREDGNDKLLSQNVCSHPTPRDIPEERRHHLPRGHSCPTYTEQLPSVNIQNTNQKGKYRKRERLQTMITDGRGGRHGEGRKLLGRGWWKCVWILSLTQLSAADRVFCYERARYHVHDLYPTVGGSRLLCLQQRTWRNISEYIYLNISHRENPKSCTVSKRLSPKTSKWIFTKNKKSISD